MSLASLPQKVRRHNLELATARSLIDEAHGRLRQSGLTSNPELEIGFDADRRFHDLMFTAGISKKFPVTNRLGLERRISTTRIQAARAEVLEIERLLIGEASMDLVKILILREQKELAKDQAQTSRQFLLDEFQKNPKLFHQPPSLHHVHQISEPYTTQRTLLGVSPQILFRRHG